MCGLCSEDTKRAARESMHATAEHMRDLADMYDAMARGTINPHSEKAKLVGIKACSIVRELVQEWV